MFRQALRILGSLAQGISTALGAGFDILELTGSKEAAVAASLVALASDTTATYNFQGGVQKDLENPPGEKVVFSSRSEAAPAVIATPAPPTEQSPILTITPPQKSRPTMRSKLEDAVKLSSSRGTRGSINGSALAVNSDDEDEDEEVIVYQSFPPDTPASPPATVETAQSCCSTRSIIGMLYFGMDIGKNLGNRFLDLRALWPYLFSYKPHLTDTFFLITLAISFPLKELFALSNDAFENIQTITGTEPFYKKALQKILPTTNWRQGLRCLGALDHAIFDSTLPWLLLISLKEVEETGLATVLCPFIPVALVSFIHAYYFEGSHTINNIEPKDREVVKDYTKMPMAGLKLLDKTTLLMGPLHGAITTTNIFMVLKDEVFQDKQWAALICAIFCGLCYSGLIQDSEVREVRRNLRQVMLDAALVNRSTHDEEEGTRIEDTPFSPGDSVGSYGRAA